MHMTKTSVSETWIEQNCQKNLQPFLEKTLQKFLIWQSVLVVVKVHIKKLTEKRLLEN